MEVTIQEIFDEVEAVNVYRNGSTIQSLPSQMSYKLIINGFKHLLEGARQMPAFGVSIDSETRNAVKRGTWVEFEFGKTLCYSDMYFEKLLVQVIADYSGFNIIRYNSNEGYAGRCFYFDIPQNMSAFYDILQTV